MFNSLRKTYQHYLPGLKNADIFDEVVLFPACSAFGVAA